MKNMSITRFFILLPLIILFSCKKDKKKETTQNFIKNDSTVVKIKYKKRNIDDLKDNTIVYEWESFLALDKTIRDFYKSPSISKEKSKEQLEKIQENIDKVLKSKKDIKVNIPQIKSRFKVLKISLGKLEDVLENSKMITDTLNNVYYEISKKYNNLLYQITENTKNDTTSLKEN